MKKYGYTKIAFADTLKEVCKLVFGFTDEQVHGDEVKEKVDEYWRHSPREILQCVGTELFREKLPEVCCHIKDDIWIRSVERKMLRLKKEEQKDKFVITDCRFQNEAQFVRSMSGEVCQLWKVVRGNNTDSHKSELYVNEIECDVLIDNNGEISELYQRCDSVLNMLSRHHIKT